MNESAPNIILGIIVIVIAAVVTTLGAGAVDLPPWFLPLLTLVAGALLGFGIKAAQRKADELRNDGDPRNDWIADLLDEAVELGKAARHEEAHAKVARAADVAAQLRTNGGK